MKHTTEIMLELIEIIESHLDAIKNIQENPSKVTPFWTHKKGHKPALLYFLEQDLAVAVRKLKSEIEELTDELEEDFADVESPQERFNLMNGIPDGITKGALMEQVYTKEELGNIDASLPREIHLTYGVDAFFFVMNYNENIFGELEDMRKLIKQPTMIAKGSVK
tara:strand:+ start:650 stop:1144 length:495 start_codon:yes stop_codon:yes gene_type:complete